MSQNMVDNNTISPLVKQATHYVITGSTVANEYISKIIEAYNASLLLDRSWENLRCTSEIIPAETPYYYKESIDLFVIKMLDFEQTRRKYSEQIKMMDDTEFDEIKAQVQKVLETWKSKDKSLQSPIPIVTNSLIKSSIIASFDACKLSAVYEELFVLHTQSLSEEKRNELAQIDTEKKLLDNVIQTRRPFEVGYEDRHKTRVSSIQEFQFCGDILKSVYTQLEKGVALAKNGLNNLGDNQQLEPHKKEI